MIIGDPVTAPPRNTHMSKSNGSDGIENAGGKTNGT